MRRDYAEAAKWYKLAADQDHAQTQSNLGVLYQAGQGVPQDHAEAARLFRLVADSGEAVGQFNLGRLYEVGEGVPQDFGAAANWYRLAANQALDIARWPYDVAQCAAQTELKVA